jgi:hypothetical protein
VLDLEYRADPAKRDPAWAEQARAGMPASEWNREYGSEWVVYEGKAVYADFDDVHIMRGTIVALPKARLVSGWDAGPNDVNLAWALGLTAPGQPQVTIIDEYFAEDGDAEDFVQVVQSRLALEWARLGGFSLHIADQSVFTKVTVAERQSFATLMRRHGLYPSPGEISFAKRRASVNGLLCKFYQAPMGLVPRLRVHERCPQIIEGFKGGYAFGRSTIVGTGGIWKETPLKNKFSHLMNAVEYICSKLEVANASIPYEGRTLPAVRVV